MHPDSFSRMAHAAQAKPVHGFAAAALGQKQIHAGAANNGSGAGGATEIDSDQVQNSSSGEDHLPIKDGTECARKCNSRKV